MLIIIAQPKHSRNKQVITLEKKLNPVMNDRGASHHSWKLLFKSSAVIMAATLLSRIFGLIRLQVLNYHFSQQLLDPFWAAYKIPNTLRELLAEGALTVAFIPVFTYCLNQSGREAADRLATKVLSVLFLTVILLVGIGMIAAPSLMPLYVKGFANDALRVQLAVDLAVIMMPFLLFVSVGAVVMGVLNGNKHFAASAFAPIFFSIGMISFILLAPENWGPRALGWAVLLGGLLLLLFQIPFLRGRFRLRFDWKISELFKDTNLREILRLMGPAALALGVVQLNQLIAPFFASFDAGGMAALQNSILLVQMPQGVFAVAVSTAILPTLAEQAGEKDYTAFRRSMEDGLGLVLLFMIPAALFFIFMGDNIISAIFKLGGKFDLQALNKTSHALFFYAFGLIGMGGAVLANRFFYGLKDMKTPFRIAVLCVVINLGGNLIFHFSGLNFAYIALANSIAMTVNFAALLWLIQKRTGFFNWSKISVESGKIVISGSLFVLTAKGCWHLITELIGRTVAGEILAMGVAVAAGGVIFLVIAWLLKTREIAILFAMLRRRLPGRRKR